MGWYDTALICENGHAITDSLKNSPEFATKHCEKCGASTISKCPNCKTDIRGYYHVEGVISVGWEPEAPSYCHECGQPYPWTRAKIEEFKAVTQELEELNKEEREKLANSIEDIIKETPRTDRAILVIRKISSKLKEKTWRVVKAILIKVATEYVKKQLGL